MKLEDFKKELLKDPAVRSEFEKFDLAFEVGQMLIEARVIKGVTQEKLSKMIGTKQASIARAESGKHLPSLSFLKRIADAFHTYLIPPKFGFMENYVMNFNASNKGSKVKDVGSVYAQYWDKHYLFVDKTDDLSDKSFLTQGS